MSIKEELDSVKQELSTEESFIESFFKLEKFYKKYKKALIATVIVAVVAVVGNGILSYITQQTKIQANKAFNNIMAKKDVEQSLKILKEKNKKLYEIALYLQDRTKQNDVEFFKELSMYANAIAKEDTKALGTLVTNQKFLQKDFAILNKAIMEARKSDYTTAKETLKLIPTTSSVYQLSVLLRHYLITK